jgi:hypothetical protein
MKLRLEVKETVARQRLDGMGDPARALGRALVRFTFDPKGASSTALRLLHICVMFSGAASAHIPPLGWKNFGLECIVDGAAEPR